MSKLKVFVIVGLVILIWYLFLVFIFPGFCPMNICPVLSCADLQEFHLYPKCWNCSCPTQTTFFELFVELLIVLFPGLIIYIAWSLYQNRREVKKE